MGIVSDVHNNVVALEKTLKVFRDSGCSMVICAGDIIGIGPYPEETVRTIKSVENFIGVFGNHESYLCDGMDNITMSKDEYNYHLWEHKRLTNHSRRFLEGLPKETYLTVNDTIIYIAHYGLENEYYKDFKKNPSSFDLDLMFKDVDANVVIYGHDHDPVNVKGEKLYINPGSCGCPGKSKKQARCGILEITEKVTYEQISVEYDVDIVLNKIEALNYPAKEEIKKIFFGI